MHPGGCRMFRLIALADLLVPATRQSAAKFLQLSRTDLAGRDGPWSADKHDVRDNTSVSETRYACIDALRGLAVVGVVLLHASLYLQTNVAGVIVDAMTPVRMPLLMTISGMLAARLREQPARATRRAISLLWLFLCWTAIDAPLTKVSGLGHHSFYTLVTAPPSELWYLWSVALLTITIPISRRVSPFLLLPFLLMLSMFGTQLMPTLKATAYVSTMNYALFFYTGVYGGAWLRGLLVADLRHWITCVMLTAVVIAIGMLAKSTVGSAVSMRLESIFLVGLLLSSGTWLTRLPLIGRTLTVLGRKTLPVYIAHGTLLRLLEHFVLRPSMFGLMLITGSIVMATLLLEKLLTRAGLGLLYDGEKAVRAFGALREALHNFHANYLSQERRSSIAVRVTR